MRPGGLLVHGTSVTTYKCKSVKALDSFSGRTSYVYVLGGIPKTLARPKSAILRFASIIDTDGQHDVDIAAPAVNIDRAIAVCLLKPISISTE